MQEENTTTILTNLEEEIWACEQRLESLRNDYMSKTGHMPRRSLNDSSWKWTIFMTLGFAFITMIVYLLGIRHTGSSSGLGIPEFFFETDISYFAILTFYLILAVLMVQSKKLRGYQSVSLILGFWCAHWLIYDWGWYAYSYGVGEIPDLSAFHHAGFQPLVDGSTYHAVSHPKVEYFLDVLMRQAPKAIRYIGL